MPHSGLRATVAQFDPKVGDVLGNTRRIGSLYLEADGRGSELVIFPELSVTGYPLEDLVNHPDLLDAAAAAVAALAAVTAGRRAALLAGVPVRDAGGVYNAAIVCRGGRVVHWTRKKHLPNYGVFDELRNFVADAKPSLPADIGGMKIGVMICEDVWAPDVAKELRAAGAEALVSINASPYRSDVLQVRVEEVAARRVAETGLPLVYVNLVGGQDEMVFDGGSFFLDASGRRMLQLPQWSECAVDFLLAGASAGTPVLGYPDPLESDWRAMVLGLRDYAGKSGFTDVVLGLSGGIDSAVVAAVAGDALGPDRVHCVRLPSVYTAELSNSAAEQMCRHWGFPMLTLPIGGVVEAANQTLGAAGLGGLKRLTRENMQARARGYLLMTLSNDSGWLLLSTGNKSEIGVGYATLYGDMCGGFNPLKDVYKTTVFELARWRNRTRPPGLLGPGGEAIPEEIIARPPTAELAPGQKDSDSLPEYPELDAILEEMVENQASVHDIAAKGHDAETVERVYRMLLRAEYKRRQSAPGPKTTSRAFARDRRIPIVNGFNPKMIGELRDLAGGGEGA